MLCSVELVSWTIEWLGLYAEDQHSMMSHICQLQKKKKMKNILNHQTEHWIIIIEMFVDYEHGARMAVQ